MASLLVVDDDAASREYLRTLFTHSGHQVHEAAEGDTALRMIQRSRPDAVVTDVLMPGMDGCELAQALRSRPQTASLPIAFNTAYYDKLELQPLAQACGVYDVICKPATPAAVLAVVNAMLAAGRAGLAPAPATSGPDDFLNQHRLTLKAKLLHTADALQDSRRSESRLRDEVSRLEALLTETQQLTWAGAWHWNSAAGTVTVAGAAAERLGFPSAELTRRRLWEHVHPEDRDSLAAAARTVLRGGNATTTRLRLSGAAGELHELIVTCNGTWTDGRRTLSGVVQDITRIAHEERLRVHAHAMVQAEQRSRDEMHAAMAPRHLTATDGVDLAAVYLNAPKRTDTGADWYDALPLPDGRVLLSVASVAGHRAPGPAVAGPLRAVLRAYAVENPDPADMLTRLNNYLTVTGTDDTYVTALVALFDPVDGQLCLANAGHPAPVVISLHNGIPKVRRLATADPPLGIHAGVAFQTHHLTLTPDTTVYAYSDGLVDDYRRAVPDLTRLGSTVVAAMATPSGLAPTFSAQRLLNLALGSALRTAAPLEDDICMLVLRLPS